MVMSRTMAATWTIEQFAAFIAAGAAIGASVILVPDARGIAGGGLAALMVAIAAVDARSAWNWPGPIERLPAEVVMADTAYDADHLRAAIAAKGALAAIPNNPSRALKYPLDKHLYAQRHLVECCFSKQFRRVATRFEKTARNRRAVIAIAAVILWMR
jgi:transposase